MCGCVHEGLRGDWRTGVGALPGLCGHSGEDVLAWVGFGGEIFRVEWWNGKATVAGTAD